ncbi:uncharacterized protein [Aegilops tauschii subsp. strangulata]|uniref:Uncharacterized protein n=2 Tax=Triticinae TaxID=1648030 RepID=A0A453SC40_AEGTS|nr:uncharacterized protein LOC120967882 [Aegilops tauschii subsp. strangulata]XP_044443613.1 uncharacterized protein LOC123169805 [Triticum aestivum]
MIRRLLNVVVKNTSTGVHSVRRIDPYKHLFYESAGEPAASIANKAKDCALEMQALSLPEPAVSFSPSPTTLPLMGGIDLFAPMGGGEGRIVGANVAGESMLYDADERLFLHLPWINEPKGWNPVCLSIPIPGAAENSLYVMERCLGESMDAYGSSEDYTVSCFEVLEHGPRTGGHEVREMHRGWRWRVLRPPPFVLEPDYQPSVSPPTLAWLTRPTGAPPSTCHARTGALAPIALTRRGTWSNGGASGSGLCPFMGKPST